MSKEYYVVNNEEESKNLQQHLLDKGFTWVDGDSFVKLAAAEYYGYPHALTIDWTEAYKGIGYASVGFCRTAQGTELALPCSDMLVAQESGAHQWPTSPRNKYDREIFPSVYCDVYDVLRAFGVTDQALGHLIKKALAVGQRGHKDATEDYQDIFDSAKRALEQHNLFKEKK